MATYRKVTDAEKRMCRAVLDDAKAGNAAKVAAQLLIDGDLPIEEGRTAGDAIRSSIEDSLTERAATIAMSTGCGEDEAREAARIPDFGSRDNWDVPEAVSSFDSDPSSFGGETAAVSEPEKTSTGAAPIDRETYDMAKGADIEKFEAGSYFVSIRKVEPGTECYNKLEDSHYTTDSDRCFIVTGTCGEEWPINGAKLRSKYGLDPDSIKMNDKQAVKVRGGGNEIYAFRANGQHDVQTSWGDVLKANRDGVGHGRGDMIVSDTPDFSGDVWVVNGEAFVNTYAPVGTAAAVRKLMEEEKAKEEELRRRQEAYAKRVEEQRKQSPEYQRQQREREMIENNPHSDYARPSVLKCLIDIDTDIDTAGVTQELKDAAIDAWKQEHPGKEPTRRDSMPYYRPAVAFYDDTWMMHDAYNAKDYAWEPSRIDGLSDEATLDRDEAIGMAFDYVTDEANAEQMRYGAPYTARDGERKRYDRKNHETMVYVGGYTRMRFGKAEQVGGYWKSTGKWHD